MGAATRIIFYLIPLVFLIIVTVIFFGQKGAWEDLKDAVLSAKEIFPEVKVGLEEQKADVSIPALHQEQIGKLLETIKSMLGPGKENCFANYGGFTDLGEKGTSLTLELKGDKTILTVRGGAGGKQIITDLYQEFSAVVPCAIAGPGDVSERFFNYFIKGEEKLLYPYYHPVNSLAIFYGARGGDGNRISVGDFDSDTVNDEADNLEDNGWLFTPDGQHICFFPTNKISNFDDDGIANEWFTPGEENSIPNRIKEGKKEGKVKLCS